MDLTSQLCVAVADADPREVTVLLAKGANPNLVGTSEIAHIAHRTPLWSAANLAGMLLSSSWAELCEQLDDALPLRRPQSSPLEHTALINIAERLLMAGAGTEILCFGTTPLAQAVHAQDIEMVRVLLDHGASANARSLSTLSKHAKRERIKGPLGIMGYFNTVLHTAVERGNPEIVKLLVSRGANRDLPDHEGLTPLDLARQASNGNVVRILVSRGIDCA